MITMEPFTIVLAVSGLLFLGNMLATAMVIRLEHSTAREKAAQLALVWLVPLLGAGTVLWVQAAIGSRDAPRGPPTDPELDVWTAHRLEMADETPDTRSDSS
jgi:hypothetical protein